MGNSSSSNFSRHYHQSEIGTHKSHNTKIPKHFQPLKRKKTKKAASSNNVIDENTNCSYHKKTPVTMILNPIKTLQPNCRQEDVNDQTAIDQTAPSPQLFRWTEGRRFQNTNDLIYPLPNDQSEIDRHRVQYYVIRWAFESRHIVPPMIKQQLFEGIRVLDVGCGPGLWLGHPIIDMAQEFRKSTFDSIDVCNLLPHSLYSVCNDNSTIHVDKQQEYCELSFPESSPADQFIQQPNFKFTCYNISKCASLPFDTDIFDYTQQALATLCYNQQDWKNVVLELKRVTKPGGYIQLTEIDLYSQPLGVHGGFWRDQIFKAMRERDLDPRIACKLDKLLAETGLIDIEMRFVSVPIGLWGLDIGNLWKQNVAAFLEAAKPCLVEMLNVTSGQYEKDLKKFWDELEDIKPFNNIYVAYGRVPFDEK